MTENTVTPNTAPAATPVATPDTAINIGGGLTAEQVRSWADQEVKAGRQTRAEADAMLAADGVPAKAAPSSVEAHLTEMGFAPAKAEQFTLPALNAPDAPFDKHAQAADKMVRSWLETAGLTREIGNFVAAEVDRTATTYQRMSGSERKLWEQGQRTNLERVWGADTNKKIALAQQLVAEIEAKAPGLVYVLEETGAGSSALVIAQLALHAERLAARPEKKG
jgi:hypothetical protein